MNQYSGLGALGALGFGIRRKIFVSYHHANDQRYYDYFSQFFSAQYEAIQDNSLDRLVDSTDTEYVMRRIRERYISGTSCTIVLCGPETWKRKYVDWEIKATLDKQHGLLGIILPECRKGANGAFIVPDRFHHNVVSGYAVWTTWGNLFQQHPTLPLTQFIEKANATPKSLMDNRHPMMSRNGG